VLVSRACSTSVENPAADTGEGEKYEKGKISSPLSVTAAAARIILLPV
jgi:hypothetical protein